MPTQNLGKVKVKTLVRKRKTVQKPKLGEEGGEQDISYPVGTLLFVQLEIAKGQWQNTVVQVQDKNSNTDKSAANPQDDSFLVSCMEVLRSESSTLLKWPTRPRLLNIQIEDVMCKLEETLEIPVNPLASSSSSIYFCLSAKDTNTVNYMLGTRKVCHYSSLIILLNTVFPLSYLILLLFI